MKLKLSQLNKDLIKSSFVGKMSFSELDKISEFTYRKIENDGSDNKFFQRLSDQEKIKKIANYIKNSLIDEEGIIKKDKKSIVLFPTAIILSINERDENTESEITWDGEYLTFDTKLYKAFIIDGQHRLLGIKKFYEENKLTFDELDIELPITMLVGYDIWEQSKIFATVNFEQKAVNKSLYYDLFGSQEGEYNEYTLSHSIVKKLNYSKSDPFFGLIKMLGTGSGTISQAFLVEKIKELFKPEKAFSILYDEYKNKKTDPIIIYNILSIYFQIIKEKFSEHYPKPKIDGSYSIFEQSILFKTTGVGAFLKLFNDFEKEIKLNNNNIQYLKEYFNKIFSLINKTEAKKLFGIEGDFSRSGGEGLQSRLYKKMKEIIDYKKDVIGKKHNNLIILDIEHGKSDEYNRNHHILTFDNSTTIINDDELENIKKQNINNN